MKILIIDNYDSFTYNLYQYLGEVLKENSYKIDVFRNDKITLSEIKKYKYDRIIISPGPGSCEEEKYFGISGKVILEIGKTLPLLGVCLGMQGIVHFFGGKIKKAQNIMHGKVSRIKHNKKGLYKNISQGIEVMRYHSLIVDKATLPNEIKVTSIVEGEEDILMGIKHIKYPIYGTQFHPESFATEGGKKMLTNFLYL